MKISFTPVINNTKAVNNITKKETNIVPNNNEKEIQKNSVSELIGRSQTVSFKASTFPGARFTEHSWVERSEDKKKIFNKLVCDNETGDRTHLKTDRYGNFVGRDEYYIQQKSRIVSTIDDNGISTITTLTPTTKTQERLDSENRPILVAHTDAQGNKRVEITDYNRGRMVVRETIQGQEQPLRVFDIRTGKEVQSGSLVIDRRYDQTTGTFITENIITKDVLKREKLTPKGFVLSQTIYFPETGMIKTHKEFNKQIDAYEISTYSGTEGNPISTFVIESRDQRKKQVKTYEADGKTLYSNILYIKKKNSDEVASETKFKGDSQIIEQKIVYGKAAGRIEYYYSEEPNIPRCSLEYDKNGTQKCETYYALDGKTPTLINVFKEDGSIVQSLYNKEGNVYRAKYFTANKQLEYLEEFDPDSQALKHSVSFNLENGNRTITIYDEEYETAYKQTVTTKDGLVLVQTIFHPDGETPQYIKRFRKDRSYTITEYNEKGIKLKSKDYNADGTKRIKDSQPSQTTSVEQKTQTNEKEEEFLRRIVKGMEKEENINKTLTESDWTRLTQILELNDSNMIKQMEPQTCRSLVLKFHPEHSTETTKIRNQQIFKIINALYKGQNS